MIGSAQTLVSPARRLARRPVVGAGLGASVSNLASAAGPALDLAADPPGQSARFATAPLEHPLTVTGTSTVTVEVSTLAAPGEAVLFAKLYDVSPQGRRTLPGGAVVRDPAAGRACRTAGPADRHAARNRPPGAGGAPPRARAVAATDQAYANPLVPGPVHRRR